MLPFTRQAKKPTKNSNGLLKIIRGTLVPVRFGKQTVDTDQLLRGIRTEKQVRTFFQILGFSLPSTRSEECCIFTIDGLSVSDTDGWREMIEKNHHPLEIARGFF